MRRYRKEKFQFPLKVCLFWVLMICVFLGVFHRPIQMAIEAFDTNYGIYFLRYYLHVGWLMGMEVDYQWADFDLGRDKNWHSAHLMCFLGMSSSVIFHVLVGYLFMHGLMILGRWAFGDMAWEQNKEITKKQMWDSSPVVWIALILSPFIGIFAMALG